MSAMSDDVLRPSIGIGMWYVSSVGVDVGDAGDFPASFALRLAEREPLGVIALDVGVNPVPCTQSRRR